MTLTAVLFVGGESRRMGVDKATLLVGGESLWSRQLKILRELKPDALFISARTRPDWCPPEVEVVLDEAPSRGPVSGLAAALGKIQTTHLLALAIDLPRMNAAHLQKIWRQARPRSGVIPSFDGNVEPLCAIYPGGDLAVAAAKDVLAGDDWSLRKFADFLSRRGQLEIFSVSPTERVFYTNANTPEEFAALKNP